MEQRAWQDVAKDFGIKTDLSSLLSEIDSVIFDCDGVVWRGDAAIDKSKDFINALYKLKKKFCLYPIMRPKRLHNTRKNLPRCPYL